MKSKNALREIESIEKLASDAQIRIKDKADTFPIKWRMSTREALVTLKLITNNDYDDIIFNGLLLYAKQLKKVIEGNEEKSEKQVRKTG